MKILIRLPDSTIRARIALTIFVVSTAALVLMAGAIYFGFRKSLLDNFDDSLHARARANLSLVDQSGSQLSLRLSGAPQDITEEDVAFTLLFGGTGELLASNLASSRQITDESELVARALSGSEEFQTLTIGRAEFRLVALPVERDGASAGAIVAGARRDSVYETLGLLRTVLLLVVPVTAGVLAVLAFLVARRALRPVHDITTAARNIAAGDLRQRIGSVASQDEVGELASTFNTMIERLEETIERERRFTGDASHELRTPLTAMEAALDVTLSQERSPEEYRGALQSLKARTAQMTRMARQLLMLSRMDASALRIVFTPIVLSELLEAVLDSFADKNPTVTLLPTLVSAAATIDGDAELLALSFTNILQNSVVHGGPDVEIRVELRAESGRACVILQDNGPGIPSESLPSIMHRFARGNASQERAGAGLGLAIVDSIVRLHRGTVTIASSPSGTRVTFDFPLGSRP